MHSPRRFQKTSRRALRLRRIPFFVTDVHWSPKHCDNLFNLSRFYDIFLFFVTNVHGWILKPKTSRRFVEFVAMQPTMPRCLSKFVVFGKKQPPHLGATSPPREAPPHPGTTSPPRERTGPTSIPRKRHLTEAPRHLHASAQGPPQYHASATSPRRHVTSTQASRGPPHYHASANSPRRHVTSTRASRAHHTSAISPRACASH
jgi:hypothetical protein